MEAYKQNLPEDYQFLQLMQIAIQKEKFKAELNLNTLSIRVAQKLDIKTKIQAVQNYDGAIMYHILAVITDEDIMSDGIADNFAAFGQNTDKALEQGVANFMGTVFPTLMGVMADNQYDEDLKLLWNNTEVLVHANYGPLRIQGRMPEDLEAHNRSMIELIEDNVLPRLQPKKINWMKIYIANNNGNFTGECILNDEYLQQELEVLKNYALSWQVESKFMAMKQFIIFRLCDKYDDVIK